MGARRAARTGPQTAAGARPAPRGPRGPPPKVRGKVRGPRSKVQGPRSKVQGPRSKVQAKKVKRGGSGVQAPARAELGDPRRAGEV